MSRVDRPLGLAEVWRDVRADAFVHGTPARRIRRGRLSSRLHGQHET